MDTKTLAEKNYKRGLWTREMLYALVGKGALTEEQYSCIING